MRLNAFTLALCVCLYQVRSASIKAPEKKLDDLDNVDLDVAEPDLIDQPSDVDIDNNLRKNIIDFPVKVIKESNIKVLDKNLNDYVPHNDDSINIKRLEIDISDSGLPQHQEHETRNPESYGAKEKAIFDVKQSIVDTQNVFNTGLQRVSISLKTLFAANEDLPAIQRNIQNLVQTFEGQIEKLNVTIRFHFKEQKKPSEGASIDPDIQIVYSGLRNLESNFRSGVDTLTEGVEVLLILREEDEVARAESTLKQFGTSDASAPQPAPSILSVKNPPQITQPVMSFINVFQQGIVTGLDNLNFIVQTFLGNPQGSNPQIHIGNPIVNFIQGITGSNNGQTQNPSNQATASEAPTAGSQNDVAAVVPVAAPTPAPWSIGAAFQQVQNSFQNLISQQQNQQQSQPQANGSISQAFQNIVQFIRPGQGNALQPVTQPAITVPAKAPEATVPETSNDVPAKPAPAPTVATPVQAQLVQAPQPGPIQQLVQNNPIIKGIQSAVQRIQNPSADTPRNEEVRENIVDNDVNPKGHHGGNNNNNNNNNNNFNQVTAWGNFVTGLIGSISAVINGTTANVSTAVNSAINTLGTNIQVHAEPTAFNVSTKYR